MSAVGVLEAGNSPLLGWEGRLVSREQGPEGSLCSSGPMATGRTGWPTYARPAPLLLGVTCPSPLGPSLGFPAHHGSWMDAGPGLWGLFPPL